MFIGAGQSHLKGKTRPRQNKNTYLVSSDILNGSNFFFKVAQPFCRYLHNRKQFRAQNCKNDLLKGMKTIYYHPLN